MGPASEVTVDLGGRGSGDVVGVAGWVGTTTILIVAVASDPRVPSSRVTTPPTTMQLP